MRIVLSGALADPRHARELLPYLQKTAPQLVNWFERSRSDCIVADPAKTWCTPLEYWQLLDHGFQPQPDQVASAGLGPLLADEPTSDDTAFWLLELVHISPSRDGAVLIPADQLAITPEQSAALLESARPLFADTGFAVDGCSTSHWRVTLPDSFQPRCPSPALVASTTVNDWWRQDIEGRPWRRLANELQMLWFDHNINQQRMADQQIPINGVWLFGGGRASQFRHTTGALADTIIDHSLAAPLYAQDWGAWLAALGQLESRLFAPQPNKPAELILTGHDRIVALSPHKGAWSRLWPGAKDAWKKWWSPQN